MIDNTVGELAGVIDAHPVLDGAPVPAALLDQPVAAMVADSRLAGPGSLFVALGGERVDGHAYVAHACSAGALAAVTSRPVPGALCLVVDDPLQALGAIGRHVTVRAKAGGLRVIGITGSAGKTSTKDLLAQILERFAPVVSPRESMNNEIGLPLTASRCTGADRFLISEMGAKGIGHIRYLCELTPPDVGVELNVGIAHLGRFGSRDNIARAKAELVEALAPDGVAVLNAADHRVQAMAQRTTASVLNFAVRDDPEPAVRAGDGSELTGSMPQRGPETVFAHRLTPDDLDHWRFELVIGGTGHHVGLGLVGRHQVANAVAAAAAAHAVGVPPGVIAAALNQANPRSHWRMELHRLAAGAVLINDAYNANPTSVRAALATLHNVAQRRAGSPTGRTIAVLGEMLELGDASTRMHQDIGAAVADHQVDVLVGVGAGAEPIIAGAREAGMAAEQVLSAPDPAAVTRLLGDLLPGDVVLVKASRDIGLETTAEELIARQPASGEVKR